LSAEDASAMRGLLPVAHVVERYLGLTETFIHEYLAAFRGVRPVVIARGLEHLELFPLPPGAELHQSPPARGTAAWAAAAVRRRLRGGEPHLEGILTDAGVKVVHAHYGPTACQVLDVCVRADLPLVTSFYGYDASMVGVLHEFEERYRSLFARGAAFLVEGSAMKQKLVALGCPPHKLHLQRIAIDPARYPFRLRARSAQGTVTILQCGRMVPKKGYDLALRALAEARRRDPGLRLRILGDGPERESLTALISELGLDEAVTLLGRGPRTLFLEELARADLYLQPSRVGPDGDSEGGAPTTLLEAQASGLPVLSSRHADIPEIVREGESALLVEEEDVAGLAEALLSLARSPERWPGMGRAGRAHVEAHHDVRKLASALEALYGTLAVRAPA
jgi:colanic acid/amylovoran biosynthesis glycosyltransferase